MFAGAARAREIAIATAIAIPAGAGGAGCGDAILIEIDGDLPVGSGVDAVCLAVADRDAAGGQFGRHYRLDDRTLPQSLRVEPGDATAAEAWAIGYRGGVPVARDAAAVDFGGDVTLRLDRCRVGAGGAPGSRGETTGPAGAMLAALTGRGGDRVVAVAPTGAAVVDAIDGAIVATAAPDPPGNGAIRGVVAIDVDGDCDDDVVVIAADAPPAIWRADGATLIDAGTIGTTAVRAAAAADVDRDGDIDLITASGADLTLYRNDGAARFVADPAALTGAGFVADATAIVAGDLDGDGSTDLVVGQSAAPLRAFLGDPAGAGVFVGAPAVLPDVAVAARDLELVDIDGDDDPDLWVAIAGDAVRLYINREGRLENQSFVRLPQPAPEVAVVAAGGWDADCAVDAALVAPGGTTLLRGDGNGALIGDGSTGGGGAAEIVDLDDDGHNDLVIATAMGVAWLAR